MNAQIHLSGSTRARGLNLNQSRGTLRKTYRAEVAVTYGEFMRRFLAYSAPRLIAAGSETDGEIKRLRNFDCIVIDHLNRKHMFLCTFHNVDVGVDAGAAAAVVSRQSIIKRRLGIFAFQNQIQAARRRRIRQHQLNRNRAVAFICNCLELLEFYLVIIILNGDRVRLPRNLQQIFRHRKIAEYILRRVPGAPDILNT